MKPLRRRLWASENEERRALLFLLLLFLLVVEPLVFRGHIAVGVDQYDDYRQRPSPESADSIQLPRLTDVNRVFIPKLQLHFQNEHAGWNNTWNPHTQLGKPASHFGGYSKAYPITYCLSFFTKDPYRLHAWISIGNLLLMVFFSFRFLLELGLHPAAAMMGAVGIALNTRSAYWFGFAQFLSWVTWSLGVMWLALRLARSFRWAEWLGLALCCYCLIISARHQATIRTAYLIIPFALLMILEHRRSWQGRLRALAVLGAAPLLGLLLSLPLAHDFISQGVGSTRNQTDTTELILGNRNDFLEHDLSMLWNVFAFGNPSRPEYPLKTPALNLNPLFFALLFVALLTQARRRAWLFLSILVLFLAMTSSRTIHLLAVRYAGFGFSAASPLGGLYLPAFVVCAFGIDALLEDRDRKRIALLRPLLAVAGATLLGIASVLAHPSSQIDWTSFSWGLVLAAVAAVFVRWRTPLVLYCGAGLSVLLFTAPALLHRPAGQVARSSPLVERIAQLTEDGHRYAKFGSARTFLPSNQEVLAGLRSIHTYDSLSSARYGRLTAELSDEGVHQYGRHFDRLDDLEKIQSAAMSYTGVSVLLADRQLQLPGWQEQQLDQSGFLYVLDQPPPLVAHLHDGSGLASGTRAVTLDGRLEERASPIRTLSRRDNQLSALLHPVDHHSLLFVSTQYHDDWRAWVEPGQEPLPTIVINDFYLGVVLPPRAQAIELRFQPLARWSWVPLAIFALSFLGVAAHRLSPLARGLLERRTPASH